MDVASLEALIQGGETTVWETRPVPRATLADLDLTLVEAYLAERPSRSKLAGRLSNLEEILLNIGCATITKIEAQQDIIRPTNAGLVLFGYDPQQFLIQAEVICVLYKDKIGKQRYPRIVKRTFLEQQQHFLPQIKRSRERQESMRILLVR